MLKKSIFIFMLLFALNINSLNIYAYDVSTLLNSDIKKPEVSAKSAIVMELNTGDILYCYNEHEKLYPASITKILTALIALEYNHPEDTITFSDNAIWGIDRTSSNLAIDVNEQLNMTDALYCIMLASANDAAMGIAEHIGGSVENFAKLMNERAKEAGALDSNFVNPHGLHNKEHYTTAYDMAMISKSAYELEQFRKICSTVTYQVLPTNKQPEIRYLANYHEMLKNYSPFHYDYCTGGKTGFTDEAQSTLVTFAENDGLKLVCVVMYEIGNTKYIDTKTLLDYCFENFKAYEINYSEDISIPVYYNSSGENINLGDLELVVKNSGSDLIVPKNISENEIIQKLNLPDCLTAPVEAEKEVGSIDFYCKNQLIKSLDVVSSKDLNYIPAVKTSEEFSDKEKSVEDKKMPVWIKIIIFIFSLILLFVIYIKYRKYTIRKKRLKKSKYKTPKRFK